MKIEGYEEISGKEWEKIQEDKRAMFVPMDKNHIHYFKKAQKFPIPFKIDTNHCIGVQKDGQMEFNYDDETVFTLLPEEIPFLVKAVEKAKEVMKKK